MSTDSNKALVRHFIEQLDEGNLDIVDEVCAPDCRCYFPKTISPDLLTREQYKRFATNTVVASFVTAWSTGSRS